MALKFYKRGKKLRGDRRVGDAEQDFKTVHSFLKYDMEVNSEESAEINSRKIVEAWLKRKSLKVK